MGFHSVNSPICALQPKTVGFNWVDFIWAKNWLSSAVMSFCLLNKYFSISVQLHVYQNEGNVDQNESYLAEVRMLNFTVNVSMRHSSSTTRPIHRHEQFVSFYPLWRESNWWSLTQAQLTSVSWKAWYNNSNKFFSPANVRSWQNPSDNSNIG